MQTTQRSLPVNPKDKANPISLLFFFWTFEFFKRGYKKVLQAEDLFQPLRVDKSELLGDRLERQWQKELKKPGKPSLLKAMAATFWREYALLGLLAAFNDFCLRLSRPIVLGILLSYFRVDHTNNSDNTGALYFGAGLLTLSAISSICFNQYNLNGFHIGMKMRVAVCSLVYRKALRLSRTALGDTAPGKIANLLSNDVSRFDQVSLLLHFMWTAPLLGIIIGVLLWAEAGWAGVVGIIMVFTVVPIQSYTGKLSSKFRYQTAIRTDERVRFMDEIISGVQVIKMYAWEIPFSKLIEFVRCVELKIIRKNSHVRAIYMTFNMFTMRAAMFFTMMTMALTSYAISADRIFVIASYFGILSWAMSQMFVRGVAEIAETLVAFKRLQTFLENDEKKDVKRTILNGIEDKGKLEDDILDGVIISLDKITAKWDVIEDQTRDNEKLTNEVDVDINKFEDDQQPTLQNISIDFKRGTLIGVVGSVGAGKSSLLQVILGEIPIVSGSVNVLGTLSYACQEPWVFGGSIRQNIMFGQIMNRSQYDSIVKSCALLIDFEQFPKGDETIIGEKGASLSGGQKARINLARAMYRKADAYLFDDPLSAVDTHVGRHLFDEVIGPQGKLAKQGATRILVTHQVHFLKDADWVVILNDGKVEAQGTPKDLAKTGFNLAELLKDDEKSPPSDSLRRSRSRTPSKSSAASLQSLLDAVDDDEGRVNTTEQEDQPQALEKSSKGTIKGSLLRKYLNSGGNPCVLATMLFLFIGSQFAGSSADYWVSFWTSQEELKTLQNERLARFNNTNIDTNFANTVGEFFSTGTCMAIHGGIIVAILITATIRSIGFYALAMKASLNLHNGMFLGIISAPMRFFDINPSGRILNRFSKDLGACDEMLPKAMLDASQIILNMVGSIALTAVVKPIFLVPVSVLGCLFWFIRNFYLKTSKNLKRLEGMTRSPVFIHLSTSISGLSTIRAFGAEKELIREFDAHQDLHTASWFMYLSSTIGFGFSLDLICLIYLCCVTFYFLLLDKDTTGDKIGLAITQAMALTGLLQWGIKQSAETSNQLMSVERILEYKGLTPEKEPEKPREISKTWIEDGKLEFQNVVYRHYEGAQPVLKKVNFLINAEEKIGIVGRTGAGKSSLIGALFRLAIVEGDILIDDINTAQIKLRHLRSKLSIIPQDPVLFSGTLRRNLDPFEEYSDLDIWQALEAVELKELANGPLGLQTAVMAGGSNFSVGQRQLVCLARAILRKNKLLVLDEATANVDPHTDGLIQTTIRQRFLNCTVLTIAHRLHTIMDSDRVLVMELGTVVEFDAPHILLQNPNGVFRGMVKATGSQESERLHELAKLKYDSLNKLL